ncbi:MAG: hypothetical protein IJD68_04650 [Ruminococcus sp.]|nr:hypothetical protein [Ruminococcus sp.]
MKKKTKLLVLLLALVMMCLCLSGCDELDDLKNQQAYWTDAGSPESITYKGEVYKRVHYKGNKPDVLYNSNYNIENYINVTEKDVPVLLSNYSGDTLEISSNGNFLSGYLYSRFKTEYENIYESGFDTLYCKEDIHKEISKAVEEGIEYPLFGYSIYAYDYEADEEKFEYHYLTKEESDIINEILDTVEPTTDDGYRLADYSVVASLDTVSEDKNFGVSYAYEINFDYLDTYYISSSDEYGLDYLYYKVPKKYNKFFKELDEKVTDYTDYEYDPNTYEYYYAY